MDSAVVVKIAHLARLAITSEEVPHYQRTLTDILTLVERLQAVDTDQVEPMAHPLDRTQRLRADVVTECVERAEFQMIAPQAEAGLYLVPRVIE